MNLQRLIKTFKTGKGFDQVALVQKVNLTAAGNGSCTAVFKVDADTCNNEGYLAPGYTATIFDTITSLGAMTLLNNVHVSVNINIRYYATAKLGEEIVVSSKVIKSGRNLLYLEGTLKNKETGDMVAKGTHIKYVLDKILYD